MGNLTSVIAQIGLAFAAGASFASVLEPQADRDAALAEDVHIRQHGIRKEALRSLHSGPADPSFEAATDWLAVGQPQVRSGGAYDGNNYVHVGRSDLFYQNFQFSIPTWQSFTVGCATRGEFGEEVPNLFFDSAGTALQGITFHQVRGGSQPPNEWTPLLGTYTKSPGAETVAFFLNCRTELGWIDGDDFYFLFEFPSDGDFETTPSGREERDRWKLASGGAITTVSPIRGARSLTLPTGGSASRLLCRAPYTVDYFVTGLASAPVTVTEQPLDLNAANVSAAVSATPALDGGGRFYLETGLADGAQAARLTISNSAAGDVKVDDISRGWAYAWPKQFEPVANSPRPTTRLAASWPAELSTAQIAILDSTNTEVDRITTPLRDNTTIWIEYDGGALPTGNYTAVFELGNGAGGTIAPRRPFRLVRGADFPDTLPADHPVGFQRMAWCFFNAGIPESTVTTVEDAEAKLRTVRDDGFNFIFLYLMPEQFDVFREAADNVGVPYMLGSPFASVSIIPVMGNHTFDPGEYIDQLDLLSDFLGSPNLKSIYIQDEPSSFGITDRVRRSALLMERDGRFPPAYSFQNSTIPLGASDFPIVGTYNYPWGRILTPSPQSLDGMVTDIQDDIDYARSQGRDYWLGVKAYGIADGDVTPTYAEATAQLGLGLALGEQGYFAFLYTTVNTLSGLRKIDFQELPLLVPYRDFNNRVAALDPLLMQLSRTRTAPTEQNVIARIAQGAGGTNYLFVLNPDVLNAATVTITTNSPSVMTNEESSAVTASQTVHVETLNAGDWKLYSFSGLATPIAVAAVAIPATSNDALLVSNIRSFEPGDVPFALALSPNGEFVASDIQQNYRVYTAKEEGFGTLRASVFAKAGPGTMRYLDNATLSAGNQFYGARIFNQQQDGSLTDRLDFTFHTAGGWDALLDGNRAWIAGLYFGVSTVDFTTPLDGVRSAHVFSEADIFTSVVGPADDGSIIAVETLLGPYRMETVGSAINAERLDTPSVYTVASRSPSGRRFAVGNFDRGASVYDLDETNQWRAESKITDPLLHNADETAWLSEDTLAVVDVREGIRFYRVIDGDWRALGVWLPEARPFAIDSLATNTKGQIAIGTRSGKIIVGDASGAVLADRSDSWMVF
ncbi:hypothetical protein BH09SUM1_BH09SUM1_26830 [soil metagenome]